jgi:hypothetical protein
MRIEELKIGMAVRYENQKYKGKIEYIPNGLEMLKYNLEVLKNLNTLIQFI